MYMIYILYLMYKQHIRRPPFRGCHQAAKKRCLPVIYCSVVSQS